MSPTALRVLIARSSEGFYPPGTVLRRGIMNTEALIPAERIDIETYGTVFRVRSPKSVVAQGFVLGDTQELLYNIDVLVMDIHKIPKSSFFVEFKIDYKWDTHLIPSFQ